LRIEKGVDGKEGRRDQTEGKYKEKNKSKEQEEERRSEEKTAQGTKDSGGDTYKAREEREKVGGKEQQGKGATKKMEVGKKTGAQTCRKKMEVARRQAYREKKMFRPSRRLWEQRRQDRQR
jgi:hypothetical protein